MHLNFLSVIIPMGRPDRVGDTLASLVRQDWFPESWEVIVTGTRAAEVAPLWPQLPIKPAVLDAPARPSPTRVNGVRLAQGDWYLFIDDDIQLQEDFFSSLRDLIAGWQGERPIGAVSGRLPGVVGNFADNWVNVSNFWTQQCHEASEREWLYSAFIATPASAYHQIGGFDPRIPSGEDVDLTVRIRLSGYTVYYEPKLVGYHNHNRTTLYRAAEYFYRNGITAQFFNQHNPAVRCFSIKTALRHAWRDFQGNCALNAGSYPKFGCYRPFVLVAYWIFQLSLEWFYQKQLMQDSYYKTVPEREAGDEEAALAFACFERRRYFSGALYYIQAMVADWRAPSRR